MAQTSGLVSVAPPASVPAKRGQAAETKLKVHVQPGYHVNSNAPNDDYLIPLTLKWQPGPLEPVETVFPKPEQQNYGFSKKPVSVFTGDFQIVARFKATADAPAGQGLLIGKLRYQACSSDTCYRPATVEIRLPYDIR